MTPQEARGILGLSDAPTLTRQDVETVSAVDLSLAIPFQMQ